MFLPHILCNTQGLEQVLVNYGPVFVNKVLLAHSRTIYVHVSGRVCAKMADFEQLRQRPFGLQSLQCLLFGPLHEPCADSEFRNLTIEET